MFFLLKIYGDPNNSFTFCLSILPFLALGTWIVYIFSDTFLRWWDMLYA